MKFQKKSNKKKKKKKKKIIKIIKFGMIMNYSIIMITTD